MAADPMVPIQSNRVSVGSGPLSLLPCKGGQGFDLFVILKAFFEGFDNGINRSVGG